MDGLCWAPCFVYMHHKSTVSLQLELFHVTITSKAPKMANPDSDCRWSQRSFLSVEELVTQTNNDRRSAIFKSSEINLTPTVLRLAGRIATFCSTWALTARFKMSLIRPISHSLTPCLPKGYFDTLLLEKGAKDTYLCLHQRSWSGVGEEF